MSVRRGRRGLGEAMLYKSGIVSNPCPFDILIWLTRHRYSICKKW